MSIQCAKDANCILNFCVKLMLLFKMLGMLHPAGETPLYDKTRVRVIYY